MIADSIDGAISTSIAAGDFRIDAIVARSIARQRAVRRQRTVDDGAAEHAMGGHRFQRHGVGGRGEGVRGPVHGGEQRNVGCREPERNRELDRVEDDVLLGGKVGRTR